ncbi:hypothetical protein CPB83DRAFT_853391 [Crepidotus variabilis]|uniref:Uncharacterized protein n=1 Tax=Crepidotus variabilis TaxID=179855 RepID=A0A9P6EG23_9AGAR|nr:hypothetical protein CPB83DRAFT_853391 [Crepidotus variabilis]
MSRTLSSAADSTAEFRVLSNGDLIDIILSFDPDAFNNDIRDLKPPSVRRLYTLLNAALVSRAFYDPAMRYRWRLMVSLTPLLKLLPNFSKANERASYVSCGFCKVRQTYLTKSSGRPSTV